eukprot:GHVS01068851.1.p1 GENE.GHVS01068851.1~~GHVS01068851.1.p1  ORF type:complete len:224 (+),score=29.00 GHVS01068851.1:544-1215(+)
MVYIDSHMVRFKKIFPYHAKVELFLAFKDTNERWSFIQPQSILYRNGKTGMGVDPYFKKVYNDMNNKFIVRVDHRAKDDSAPHKCYMRVKEEHEKPNKEHGHEKGDTKRRQNVEKQEEEEEEKAKKEADKEKEEEYLKSEHIRGDMSDAGKDFHYFTFGPATLKSLIKDAEDGDKFFDIWCTYYQTRKDQKHGKKRRGPFTVLVKTTHAIAGRMLTIKNTILT